MTARADQRRRRTLIGAVVAAVLIVSAAGLTAVGANAVLNSTEGEVVAVDSRPVLSLPATDNAALAVVDDDNVYRKLGPARVFRSERAAMAAIKSRDEDQKIKAGDIMVVTCGGPLGTGMEAVS